MLEVCLFPFCFIIEDTDNLAFDRRAWQSSMRDNSSVNIITNGSSTGWGCIYTQHEETPWWTVDLGDEYQIVGVVVANTRHQTGKLCKFLPPHSEGMREGAAFTGVYPFTSGRGGGEVGVPHSYPLIILPTTDPMSPIGGSPVTCPRSLPKVYPGKGYPIPG